MSTPVRKLTHGELHLLRLVQSEADADGWTRVSKPVMSIMTKLPAELVTVESLEDERGRARLTNEGESVLSAKAWLP